MKNNMYLGGLILCLFSASPAFAEAPPATSLIMSLTDVNKTIEKIEVYGCNASYAVQYPDCQLKLVSTARDGSTKEQVLTVASTDAILRLASTLMRGSTAIHSVQNPSPCFMVRPRYLPLLSVVQTDYSQNGTHLESQQMTPVLSLERCTEASTIQPVDSLELGEARGLKVLIAVLTNESLN